MGSTPPAGSNPGGENRLLSHEGAGADLSHCRRAPRGHGEEAPCTETPMTESVEPLDDPVEVLFHQAVELPLRERAAFLDAACRGNPALRAEVESLLACDYRTLCAADLLNSPPL